MAIAFLSAERSKDPNRQVVFLFVFVFVLCIADSFCNGCHNNNNRY